VKPVLPVSVVPQAALALPVKLVFQALPDSPAERETVVHKDLPAQLVHLVFKVSLAIAVIQALQVNKV